MQPIECDNFSWNLLGVVKPLSALSVLLSKLWTRKKQKRALSTPVSGTVSIRIPTVLNHCWTNHSSEIHSHDCSKWEVEHGKVGHRRSVCKDFGGCSFLTMRGFSSSHAKKVNGHISPSVAMYDQNGWKWRWIWFDFWYFLICLAFFCVYFQQVTWNPKMDKNGPFRMAQEVPTKINSKSTKSQEVHVCRALAWASRCKSAGFIRPWRSWWGHQVGHQVGIEPEKMRTLLKKFEEIWTIAFYLSSSPTWSATFLKHCWVKLLSLVNPFQDMLIFEDYPKSSKINTMYHQMPNFTGPHIFRPLKFSGRCPAPRENGAPWTAPAAPVTPIQHMWDPLGIEAHSFGGCRAEVPTFFGYWTYLNLITKVFLTQSVELTTTSHSEHRAPCSSGTPRRPALHAETPLAPEALGSKTLGQSMKQK